MHPRYKRCFPGGESCLPGFGTCAHIFLDLLQDLTMFACRQRDVCGDFVKSRDVPTQSFGGAHRGRVYVRVFIEMSMRTC